MTATADVLGRLELAGLIRLARTEPQVEYLFRHALVHDAAYDSIARKDRRSLHRAAGEILEELHPGGLDEIASALAFHYVRAGLPERAISYQLRAADRAARGYANAEAIDLYSDALEGPAAETLEQHERARAYERFGGVLELVGKLDEAIGAYEHALELAVEGDFRWIARLHRRIGNAHRIARRVPEARASFAAASALLDEVPPDERGQEWWAERIDLLLDRAWLHYFWAELDEMRGVLDECAPALDRYATDAQRTRYHARVALHLARLNHMFMTDEVVAAGRRAYEQWRAVGDPTDAELAQFQLGLFHVNRGELEEGRKYLSGSLAAAELTGDVVLQSRCLTYLALAARFAGDADDMERIHERALNAITAGGMAEYSALIEANRCWSAWRRGDTDLARTHAAAALADAARLPAKEIITASARLPLLAAALEAGDLDDAIEQAAELIAAIWVDDEYIKALAEAVEAHRAGDLERARRSLEHALQRARRVGWV